MRIPLDECVNPRLRQAFPDYEMLTVAEANWRALSDAELIAQAQGRCDVLVTTDKGFEYERNLGKLGFGNVIVHVLRNRMEYCRPLFAALVDAVGRAKWGRGDPCERTFGATALTARGSSPDRLKPAPPGLRTAFLKSLRPYWRYRRAAMRARKSA